MKETFADRLKAAMEQRGLKQVDLIREAEQAHGVLRRAENIGKVVLTFI